MKYLPYVNVKQGTQSVPEFSCGNTLPLTAVPHGMNHFALDTRGMSHPLFFHPTDHFTTGIRLTHMPSPWINDYGHMTFMASSGDGIGAGINGECRSSFTPARSVMQPDMLRVEMQRFHTVMELAPTVRGAVLRMHWDTEEVRRFCLKHFGEHATISVDPANRMVSGYTTAHTWETHENFKMYYVLHFDAAFRMDQTRVQEGKAAALNLAFDTNASEITAQVATSFISLEQAMRNLSNEVAGKTFEEVQGDAARQWEECLSLIEIEAEDAVKRTFYSCLYRMMLFPRIFHEYDENGNAKHYSPDIGEVRDGVFYTDNGFWDTYKTVYPLYSLILPDLYREMCEGFCNYYDEAGWLPRWLSPGAVNCMPGTAIDAVFGDAAVKNIVTDQTLLSRMLTSTMHHVKNVAENPAFGRDGVESFNRLGWVSDDHGESVNKTQDYAYGNFCIAQIAKKLGKDSLADELLTSSLSYRNLFDPASGFLRARNEKGEMRKDWTPIQWGKDYTEGSAWQNSLAMFHDYGGMTKLLGGRSKMEAHLDRLFATKPDYDVYGYGFEIHEMIEMAAVDFGQCAMSNQPSFHIPYLYSYIGKPEKTQYWTRKIMKELFSDSVTGYPGDEDNGSMAGWYVFSALGFYPVCPGAPEYVLGSPCVSRAVLHLGNGASLTVTAEGQGEKAVYLSDVRMNGDSVKQTYLPHTLLAEGGELCFAMSETPVCREYSDSELPYSLER